MLQFSNVEWRLKISKKIAKKSKDKIRNKLECTKSDEKFQKVKKNDGKLDE